MPWLKLLFHMTWQLLVLAIVFLGPVVLAIVNLSNSVKIFKESSDRLKAKTDAVERDYSKRLNEIGPNSIGNR